MSILYIKSYKIGFGVYFFKTKMIFYAVKGKNTNCIKKIMHMKCNNWDKFKDIFCKWSYQSMKRNIIIKNELYSCLIDQLDMLPR